MLGIGVQEHISILSGIVVLIGILAFIRNKKYFRYVGPSLVLKRFEINQNPKNEIEDVIHIAGRKAGILSWLFNLVGIDATETITVNSQEFRHKAAGLMGQMQEVCPLTSISTVHCGYRRPIWYLIFSVAALLIGLFAWASEDQGFKFFIIGFLVGLALICAYILLKKISIEIHTRGGLFIGLIFKRSIIENIAVDIEQARKVISVITDLVNAAQKREIRTNNIPFQTSGRNYDLKSTHCVNCGQPLEGGKFCTSCGKTI